MGGLRPLRPSEVNRLRGGSPQQLRRTWPDPGSSYPASRISTGRIRPAA